MPHDDAHHHVHLSRAVRAIFSVTLLSRVGGLVRDVIVGRLFGNTWIGSAFQAAFQIPNLFRRLFGEGALSAAFIPVYTETLRDGEGEEEDPSPRPSPHPPNFKANGERGEIAAGRFASLTVAVLGVVTAALTVVAEVGLLIALMVLPRDPERDLSIKLIMVMLPFMPLICVAAILAGMLQVHGRFGPASSGPVLLNAFIVAVGGYFLIVHEDAGPTVAYVLGAATVLSGVSQCWWFVKLLRPHVRWTAAYRQAVPRARVMLRKFVPVAIGLGTLQLNTFMDTLIAMYPIWVGATVFGYEYPLNEASNSVLSLTQRLYQFPLGVFGIAVATAVFPLLSRHAAEPEKFVETLRRGIRLSFFIGLPASVGLVLVRHDITYVVYGGGSKGFDADGLMRSAAVLAGHATGIWAYSLNHVFTRAMYAKGDTLTPMKVAMGSVVLNLVLNVTLIWQLQEAGMAWATSIAAMVQCLVLGWLVRRVAGGSLTDGATRGSMLKVVAASAVMGLGVFGALWFVPAASSWTGHLVALGVGTGVGLAVFGGMAMGMRMPEVGWLVRGR